MKKPYQPLNSIVINEIYLLNIDIDVDVDEIELISQLTSSYFKSIASFSDKYGSLSRNLAVG